jgi:hypothetical protein
MSKKTIAILKSYFETGDRPTESQFADLIDSFYHKDNGKLVSNVTEDENGKVRFEFADSSAFEFTYPKNAEISFISGLAEALNNKVDKIVGKGLSTLDFTNEKSADIAANKTHAANADIHVTAQQKTDWDNKVDKEEGKGLSTNDFDDTANQTVSDARAHIDNVDIHVSETDKSKWTNKLQDYKVSEELSSEMGRIYRFYEKEIIRYDGTLPFVTGATPVIDDDESANWTSVFNNGVSTYSEEFVFNTGDDQNFTLTFEPTNIVLIIVQGQPLYDQQFSFSTPNNIEIIDPLDNGDRIKIIYEHFIL